MTDIKEWADGVNRKVLRSGTDWADVCGFIEDETRSGKRKRRYAGYQEKRQFSVKMNLTETEYHLFRAWFENTLKKGLFSFHFPQIDSSDKSVIKTYRFTKDGSPSYSNPSGMSISCTMRWEEQ